MTALPAHRMPVAPAPSVRPKEKAGWTSWMAVLFLLSLIVPTFIDVGTIRLLPHRISLLIFFVPCLIILFSGRVGKLTATDILFGLATVWAILALIANHGLSATVQPLGIFTVESFGGYLLARTTIRSAADFKRVGRWLLIMLLFMLPFAVHESMTGQTFLLNIIPNSAGIIDFPYRLGMRRAQVLFTHPIHYGIFAALTFGLFWFAFRPRNRLFTFPIVLGSTFFSLSSGALICLVMQLFLTTWNWVLRAVQARWYILGGLFLFLYTITNLFTNSGFFILVSRYASFNSSSAYARILIWRYGTENVVANPIFGLGLGKWERPFWLISSLDNFFLHLTMRYGLPFIMFFAAAIAVLLIQVLRAKLDSDLDQRIRLGWVIVIIGGVIVGGGTVDFWGGMLSFVMFLMGAGAWLYTGGAAAPAADGEEPEPEERPRGMRYTRFPGGATEAAPKALPSPYARPLSGEVPLGDKPKTRV